MADEEHTKWVKPPVARTRLVRREGAAESVEDRITKQFGEDDDKTMLVMRGKRQASSEEQSAVSESKSERLVAGWLVVISGPGKGGFAPIFYDLVNSVGRGGDQATRLDFGDDTISRSEHAFIYYDYKTRKYYINMGGKPNVLRLNDMPVLQQMELHNGDNLSLGQTVVRFVAFCGENFDWQE